jgi:hypothetical protein
VFLTHNRIKGLGTVFSGRDNKFFHGERLGDAACKVGKRGRILGKPAPLMHRARRRRRAVRCKSGTRAAHRLHRAFRCHPSCRLTFCNTLSIFYRQIRLCRCKYAAPENQLYEN